MKRALKETPYFYDFITYYRRAAYLQQKNKAVLAGYPASEIAPVGDDLMDLVHIYDTVERRNAGFSKVLEDLHGRRLDRYNDSSVLSNMDSLDLRTWLYIHLIHRCTGSGASFAADHGYRNTRLFEIVPIAIQQGIPGICEWWKEWDASGTSLFTSIGNQPPAFPKTTRYKRSSTEFFTSLAPRLVDDLVTNLEAYVKAWGPANIREWIDWALEWNKVNGAKKFNFVYTAWIMDIADYWPELMSPGSDVYYGNNAMEAIGLCFGHDSTNTKILDDGMKRICDAVREYDPALNAHPMDVEDCCCDYVRYIENYVPVEDYEHIDLTKTWNNSAIQNHPKGRQRWKVGTSEWIWYHKKDLKKS